VKEVKFKMITYWLTFQLLTGQPHKQGFLVRNILIKTIYPEAASTRGQRETLPYPQRLNQNQNQNGWTGFFKAVRTRP